MGKKVVLAAVLAMALAAVLAVMAIVLLAGRSKAAQRAGSALTLTPSPTTAPFDLEGPWTFSWLSADDTQPLSSGDVKRLQVNQSLQASAGSLSARYLNVDALELPAGWAPEQDDDFATHGYLESLMGGSGVEEGIGVPRGTIILWTNSTRGPTGSWVRCDGSNGTPDLRGLLLKGATAVGAGPEGASATPMNADHLPPHTHALTKTTWEVGNATRTTTAAGQHNHTPVKANLCATVDCTTRVDTPFLIRSAKRGAQGTGRSAYTTLDTVGVYQTLASPMAGDSTAASHTHTVSIAHSHTLPNAGRTTAALSTVPGHVFVGYYMRV